MSEIAQTVHINWADQTREADERIGRVLDRVGVLAPDLVTELVAAYDQARAVAWNVGYDQGYAQATADEDDDDDDDDDSYGYDKT